MALASVYTFVLTTSAMSAELRKANGYLAAGSAAIVATVMANFSSAKLFANEASLRFTMFWLLLVVALSGVSWFASIFVAARATGLQVIADLPKYGHQFLPGEVENIQSLGMRALFPFLRPLGRWQAVSYTHLDVYKRQHRPRRARTRSQARRPARRIGFRSRKSFCGPRSSRLSSSSFSG